MNEIDRMRPFGAILRITLSFRSFLRKYVSHLSQRRYLGLSHNAGCFMDWIGQLEQGVRIITVNGARTVAQIFLLVVLHN